MGDGGHENTNSTKYAPKNTTNELELPILSGHNFGNISPLTVSVEKVDTSPDRSQDLKKRKMIEIRDEKELSLEEQKEEKVTPGIVENKSVCLDINDHIK